MSSRKKHTAVHTFKRGDRFTLDSIYAIQGLAGGDWWERTGEDLHDYEREKNMDISEFLVCTRDITITIQWE